jgi:hypothetical protein
MTRIEMFVKRAKKLHMEYMKHFDKEKSMRRKCDAAKGRIRTAMRYFMLKHIFPKGVWTRGGAGILERTVKSIPREVKAFLRSEALSGMADRAEIEFTLEREDYYREYALVIAKTETGYRYRLYFLSDALIPAMAKEFKLTVDNSVEIEKLRVEEETTKRTMSVLRGKLKELKRERLALEAEQA